MGSGSWASASKSSTALARRYRCPVVRHRTLAYSVQIGLRYLRSKREATVSIITVVSIVGVALGVAALLAVLSITTGFEKAFRDKVLGVNAHVLILKYGRDFSEYRDVLKSVDEEPEVTGSAPFLITEMMLSKGDRLSGVLVKGVDPVAMREVLDLPSQIRSGSLEGLRLPDAKPAAQGGDKAEDDAWAWMSDDDKGATKNAEKKAKKKKPRETIWEQDARRLRKHKPLRKVEVADPSDIEALLAGADSGEFALPDDVLWEASLSDLSSEDSEKTTLPGMVIGITLAESLEIEVGDTVTLISPLSGFDLSMLDADTDAITTTSHDFRVIGIFEAGFQEYDSRLVYTDLFAAQKLHEDGDNVTGVELRVDDLRGSEALARRIDRKLGGIYRTLDWSELNRNLFTALKVQRRVLTIVIATIIFVAAFNVIATLIMIVLEKKREIAILKAMGATDATVLGVFMVQGLIIGVVGTVLGVAIGGGIIGYLSHVRMPLDPRVYLIDHLPVVTQPMVFVVTVAIALGICLLATLVPSWWAARMMPVDGLRYE